jgi:hypothetical protein
VTVYIFERLDHHDASDGTDVFWRLGVGHALVKEPGN